MKREPEIHVLTPLYAVTGGVQSCHALVARLARDSAVRVWALPMGDSLDAAAVDLFTDSVAPPQPVDPERGLPPGSQAVFYMSDYADLFVRHAPLWRESLAGVGSVQMVFNVNTGSLHKYPWLAGLLRCAYFQSSELRDFWRHLTRDTPLCGTPDRVLPPPVELNDYLAVVPGRDADAPRIGRLSGYVPLPANAVSFYRDLAERLPGAEFWFMPTPDEIREAFGGNPRFRLFEADEIAPTAFLAGIDVFCLPVRPNWDFLQGPRVLSEAMAAALPSVTVARWGPCDRITHSVTGFLTNDDQEMAGYVERLVRDVALRRQMGDAARQAAAGWRVEAWAESVRFHAATGSGAPGSTGGSIAR